MTLVMDGVRRTALVAPVTLGPVRRKTPVLLPITEPTTRVGMDGIRRTVPTPRDLLVSMQAAEAQADTVAEATMPTVTTAAQIAPALRDWSNVREAAKFGMVATSLTAVGVVTAVTALHTTSTPSAPAIKTVARVIAPAADASNATPISPTPVAVASAAAPIDTGLQQLVNGFAGGSNMYGIVVKNLATGETASVNGDRGIEAASLYKLFVAGEIYRRIDTGQLSLGQAAGSGSGQTIADCLNAMITVSDNTCGHALGNIVGWGALNSSLRASGYSATNLAGAYPQTSAQDVATILERAYTNTLNSPSSNDAFLGLLKSQRLNAQLPAGLPAGTVMAHKTGSLDGYIHDAGIVYGPKANYLVVVTSGPWGTPALANSQFATLSSQLWSHFQQ